MGAVKTRRKKKPVYTSDWEFACDISLVENERLEKDCKRCNQRYCSYPYKKGAQEYCFPWSN